MLADILELTIIRWATTNGARLVPLIDFWLCLFGLCARGICPYSDQCPACRDVSARPHITGRDLQRCD